MHAVQYKGQPGSVLMFCSYYFKKDSLDTLPFCSACLTFVLSFVLNSFCQNQGFCSDKIALIKKKCIYIMAKDNCFPNFSILENPFHLQLISERKRFYFVHQKDISLWTSYCVIRNGSRNSLSYKIELFITGVSD